jgi:hypothetical protein
VRGPRLTGSRDLRIAAVRAGMRLSAAGPHPLERSATRRADERLDHGRRRASRGSTVWTCVAGDDLPRIRLRRRDMEQILPETASQQSAVTRGVPIEVVR